MDEPTHIYSPAYKAKNYITHTKLDYNSPLSLYFNGKELQILEWGEVKRDSVDSAKLDKNKIFIARSGKPLSISNQDSISQANPDNTQEYFDYSKQRQKDKDKGAIPEGIYYIDITQSKDDKQSGIREYNNAWYSFSRSKEGEKQWGKYNIPIYTNKDCTNTTESSTKRQGFYIHGGESYGDNGGIDLSKEDTRFFQVLESLKQEYKEVLEYIKDDKGRIIIKLEVGYGEELSERLSEHFWVKDMIQTSYGQTYIDLNKKFAMQLENNKQLKKLCAELEKIRQFALNNGYMLQITSGVRCPELNKKLEPNASKTSQHLSASAADMIFVKNGISSKEGLKLIYKALYSSNPAERIPRYR